jgi:hypothetical protein
MLEVRNGMRGIPFKVDGDWEAFQVFPASHSYFLSDLGLRPQAEFP